MAKQQEDIRKVYFRGLRDRIIEPPVIQVFNESLTMNMDFNNDIEAFKDFLVEKGFPHADSSCFELEISKAQMLEIFEKIQADKCLAMTNCFGLDENNKFQLMQKGIIVFDTQRTDEPSDEEFIKIYTKPFRDANGEREIFKGFDLAHKIDETELRTNRERLDAFYDTAQFNKTYHGYALPVDVMIQILTDADKLGNSDVLKVTFGLTGFSLPNISATLGNFTFYISDVDTANVNYFVKCGSKLIDGSDGDCPPKMGCQ